MRVVADVVGGVPIRDVVVPGAGADQQRQQVRDGGLDLDAVGDAELLGDLVQVGDGLGVLQAGVEEHDGHVRLGLQGQVEDDEGVLAAGERDVAVVGVQMGGDAVDQRCGVVAGPDEPSQGGEVQSGLRRLHVVAVDLVGVEGRGQVQVGAPAGVHVRRADPGERRRSLLQVVWAGIRRGWAGRGCRRGAGARPPRGLGRRR